MRDRLSYENICHQGPPTLCSGSDRSGCFLFKYLGVGLVLQMGFKLALCLRSRAEAKKRCYSV